jgi:large subunit ribosomal protein L3
MAKAILGRKIGMTRYFDEDGKNVPVTVVQAGPCFVSQIKSAETDGYDALQLAFDEVKPRSSTFQTIGHDAKAGLAPQRFHREVRVTPDEAGEVELGQEIKADTFEGVEFVDVIGTSKGKGFQGGMKRHNFAGLEASHGVERKHRSPGSIGGRSSNLGTGKPKKGIRMAGHMGAERVTVRSLKVVAIDAEKNLLLIKGPVPGPKKGLVYIREAIRLYKRKAKLVSA